MVASSSNHLKRLPNLLLNWIFWLKEPFIQKYLKSLAVHVCTLPVTQVVSILVALIYIGMHPEMPRAQSWGIGLGIIALFQVVPISPGSMVRGLYVLYLVIKDLLDLPILYLSRYIIENKSKYYELLQEIRITGNWENWLLYIIEAVKATSEQTTELIKEIQALMLEYKYLIRDNYKFYSQDLLNNLFQHPYTKIEFIEKELGVSRITAANYLNKLAKDGILIKRKIGTGNYYVNQKLYEVLTRKVL